MILKPKHKIALMNTALEFAECSVSKRLKVGAVIEKNGRIVSCGYNALPSFLHGNLEDENGVTLPSVRHAEKSALMGMLREGISPVGGSLYVTHSCCEACSIDVIDAGIIRVVYLHQFRCTKGLDLMKQQGIIVEQFNFKE
jgi:dCMP deaminase